MFEAEWSGGFGVHTVIGTKFLEVHMEQKLIDADGHVIEDETLMDYLEEPYRSCKTQGGIIGPIRNVLGNVFPTLDFLHLATFKRSERAFGGGKRVGPDQWLEFLDVAKFEYAFLYPTTGLAMGNIVRIGHAWSRGLTTTGFMTAI